MYSKMLNLLRSQPREVNLGLEMDFRCDKDYVEPSFSRRVNSLIWFLSPYFSEELTSYFLPVIGNIEHIIDDK